MENAYMPNRNQYSGNEEERYGCTILRSNLRTAPPCYSSINMTSETGNSHQEDQKKFQESNEKQSFVPEKGSGGTGNMDSSSAEINGNSPRNMDSSNAEENGNTHSNIGSPNAEENGSTQMGLNPTMGLFNDENRGSSPKNISSSIADNNENNRDQMNLKCRRRAEYCGIHTRKTPEKSDSTNNNFKKDQEKNNVSVKSSENNLDCQVLKNKEIRDLQSMSSSKVVSKVEDAIFPQTMKKAAQGISNNKKIDDFSKKVTKDAINVASQSMSVSVEENSNTYVIPDSQAAPRVAKSEINRESVNRKASNKKLRPVNINAIGAASKHSLVENSKDLQNVDKCNSDGKNGGPDEYIKIAMKKEGGKRKSACLKVIVPPSPNSNKERLTPEMLRLLNSTPDFLRSETYEDSPQESQETNTSGKTALLNEKPVKPRSLMTSNVPYSSYSEAFNTEADVEIKKLTSLQSIRSNQSIYKLAYNESITDSSETSSRSLSPVDPEIHIPSSIVNDEIIVHEADTDSDAGSEDVELIPHRYECETSLNKNKNVYVNKLSLAVELLRTQENLPYDDHFKRVVDDNDPNAEDIDGEVNLGFEEDSSRSNGRKLNPARNHGRKVVTSQAKSSKNSANRGAGSSIARGDEFNDSCEEAEEGVLKASFKNRNITEEVKAAKRRYQVHLRHSFSPRATMIHPCMCCVIM